MTKYIFQIIIIIESWITFFGITFVSGQGDSGPNQQISGSTCNVTTDASGCDEDTSNSPFLLQVLIISASIAGVILFLSVGVCIWHCVRKRENEGAMDIEASSEFDMSEDASVHFRRLDGVETNRAIASVFSWGSEFSDGERKGNYADPEAIGKMSRKSRGQIYANTGIVPTEATPNQQHVPCIYTNVNQYANLHGDKRTTDSSNDDCTEPLPQ